jgi:putative phosphoesterase
MKSTKILIVGDTHISMFKDLPKQIIKNMRESDWIIHVGDFTSKNVLDGFQHFKPDFFKGVYGNSDPLEIRKSISPKLVIEISGKRIGAIHPAIGGPESFLKRRILKEFKNRNLDAIVYGHSHEAEIHWKDNLLLVNPGKGYIDKISLNPSASIALITINKEIKAEIIEIRK